MPVALAVALLLPAADVGGETSASIDFARDVRPIFNAHCSACHGGVREAGGLNLIDRESVGFVVEADD
ncbi:MAG: hypothetical protein AAF907_17375, partial [Planctomycetota bacterium]